MTSGNLFDGVTPPPSGEIFETLLRHRNLVIERIVSSSQPEPVEYVQPQDEWVILVSGEATLEVRGVDHRLNTGDYLFLPALTPHTVKHTSHGTVWLAVHLLASEE